MQSPIKVIQLDLSQPLLDIQGLEGYCGIWALVRLAGKVLGYCQLPVINGACDRVTIERQLTQQLGDKIGKALWTNGLLCGLPEQPPSVADLRALSPEEPSLDWPLVTVAVCTRDRSEDLTLCLNALATLDYPNLDLLVVDNAPSDDATQILVERYPQVRYIHEPRPGLDWARNRALREAQGDIIAYTDDDVQVDPGWVTAIARAFAANPDVMAVTGLVVPAELETEAQVMFEANGGFGKGFEPRKWEFPNGKPIHWSHVGTGNIGTGANMAYRRAVFAQIGDFDPALDVGTATGGAGDLEMFFRVLVHGFGVLYEPQAVIFHRHRRTMAELYRQIYNNGGVYAFMAAGAAKFPQLKLPLLIAGLQWFLIGQVKPLFLSYLSPQRFPRTLRWAQMKGCWYGLRSYGIAKQQAAQVVAELGPQVALESSVPTLLPAATVEALEDPEAMAVRCIQLDQPMQAIADVSAFAATRIFAEYRGRLWGFVDIANQQQPIAPVTIAQAIAAKFAPKFDAIESDWLNSYCAIPVHLQPPATAGLPLSVPVSIVLGTCDRPDDLQHCLEGLTSQQTERDYEIIVVDNRPGSGLAAPIVKPFSQVKLIEESRPGVSYARNAGILASKGEIVVTVDDDITFPPDWLEKLLAPFARADVMAVTGNVLPLELGARSQRLFENFGDGGLCRGFEAFEVDGAWFERSPTDAPPTWELGGTANAAFRKKLFEQPIGAGGIRLMEESLGPGTPAGGQEDIYLFYDILKQGHRIRYQADAYVWHRHRSTMAALAKQLFGYSRGFVAYHLTTILEDREWRALGALFFFLPLYNVKRLVLWPFGDRSYPLNFIFREISGNLIAPWGLMLSRRQVRRMGRSRSRDATTEPLSSNQLPEQQLPEQQLPEQQLPEQQLPEKRLPEQPTKNPIGSIEAKVP